MRVGLTALVVLAWLVPRAASAEEPASLSACADRVVAAARQQGARPHGTPSVEFMLPLDRSAHAHELTADECVGFLALGHRKVQDLGLTLYAPSGRVLSRSQRRDAHAYARFCGERGRHVIAQLHMRDGQGEVQLVRLRNAPARIRDLDAILSACVHAGVPRPQPAYVGPEPLGPPIDVELSSVARRLSRLGYRLQGGILLGGLPEQRREARRVTLEGGHCYALAAVGDVDVEDIDLRLFSVSGTASLLAADVTRSREAVVKVCPETSGNYLLDVRMYRGAGAYAVQRFGLVEPGRELPAGVASDTRIPYAEMLVEMGERGLRTDPAGWGLVRPNAPHVVPLHMRGGQCYGVGAVSSGDFVAADLDLTLVDDRGRPLASDQGAGRHPVVFHCPERDVLVRAVLRARELRRAGRFLLLVGTDAGGATP